MNDYIFDATAASFEQLVLDNSRRGTVLVNWWSPRAGPSLRLYPLLEKLSNEFGGRFLLINIDAEQEKTLARDQGVTSLPLLMLFRNGEVVERVHGYQPEAELRRLLERHTPRASDTLLAQAVQQWRRGDRDGALTRLVQIAMDDPANLRVPATIGKLLIGDGRLDEAWRILTALPGEIRNQGEIATLLAHLRFLRLAAEAPEQPVLRQRIDADPDDLEARQQLAALLLIADDYAGAMEQLLEVMRRDRRFGDGAGRQGLLAIFRILGNEHPLVGRYRQSMLEV
ncbi:MAG TPA: tetratricopeptide repeat protein [Sedimenticola thiotaurini]|uniref:Tetratricopeptide repeat protein n=1 Tax=Sedimenticola thiotaurini TaxID=1543721 RepID=A0A831RGU0_9GAMM|nr:tetratricopeptide repeat protein [Sedimenticola thiotaurini]